MKKVIVIGLKRTGSTVLLEALGQLEKFRVYGELFAQGSESGEKYRYRPEIIDNPDLNRMSFRTSIYSTPQEYLSWLYKKHLDCAYLGYKILYPQMRRIKFLETYLLEAPDIYKIILTRENYIKQAVSALTTSRYPSPGKDKAPPEYIRLNPSKLVVKVRNDIECFNSYIMRFAVGSYVVMSYEEMTGGENVEYLNISKISELFNGDVPTRIKATRSKYGPVSVKDRIINYEEVYKYVSKEAPEFLKWLN